MRKKNRSFLLMPGQRLSSPGGTRIRGRGASGRILVVIVG